jgi:hypothetical protein
VTSQTLLGSGYTTYGQLANDAATANGIDPTLFTALIQQESGFNSGAFHTNSNGTIDFGIAQLNSKTFPNAQNMSVAQQLNAAAKYLAGTIKSAGGDVAKGVASYNGSGTQAQQYSDKVLALAHNLGYTGDQPTMTDSQDGGLDPNMTTTSGAQAGIETRDALSRKIANIAADLGVPVLILGVAATILIFSWAGALGSSPQAPSLRHFAKG